MEKIKHFIESDMGKDILVVIIIILVGLGSFELGRLSVNTNSEGSGVKIEYPDQENQETNVIESTNNNSDNLSLNLNNLEKFSKSNSGNYFASNRGSKYYSIGCSTGKSIKQENRIYFANSTDAEKAGYVLSSSCK